MSESRLQKIAYTLLSCALTASIVILSFYAITVEAKAYDIEQQLSKLHLNK